jgi:molybdenum cofactor cytidylyltransferase
MYNIGMSNDLKFGCILLAAGEGKRFGGNKLLARLNGMPILEHILKALPIEKFADCAIVAADSKILKLADKYDISGVINDKPELKLAHSIRMGIEQMGDIDACMFLVCDQPNLKRETLSDMLDSYVSSSILSLSFHGKRGNPVIFPAFLLEELSNLSLDENGVCVINRHSEILKLYDTSDEAQLVDIDTKHDFRGCQTDK